MAAQASQPPLSTERSWSAETPGSMPAVSMPVRRTPAKGQNPATAGAGIALQMSKASSRGSAPSLRFRVFSLRTSGMRRVVHTHQSQPLPAVLQPFLPTGFATGDRTGTTVASTLQTSPAAKP